MSESTDARAGTEYHWILTVQLPDGRPAKLEGVTSIANRTTRANMLAWAKTMIQENVLEATGQHVRTSEMCVLFFDAQPNDITPGGVR